MWLPWFPRLRACSLCSVECFDPVMGKWCSLGNSDLAGHKKRDGEGLKSYGKTPESSWSRWKMMVPMEIFAFSPISSASCYMRRIHHADAGRLGVVSTHPYGEGPKKIRIDGSRIQLKFGYPTLHWYPIDIPLIVACTPQFPTEIWSTGNSEACKTCTNVEDEPSRCDAVFASVF